MNARRWLGISIFILAAVCVVGTRFSPEALALGGDKKVEISAAPDKATVKPGDGQSADIKIARGKDAKSEVTLTAEVEPKDKGVTAKIDAKVAADKNDTKLTIETTAATADGDYKVVVKSKSADSPDGSATFTLSVKKVEVPVVKGAGEKLPFKAFDDPKKPFYQEQTTETTQDMTVQGQKVTQKQKQTFMILWTPMEKKDGNFVVKQQIKGVKMEIDIGGNKIEYDSTKKNPKNPMTDFFEKLTDEKQFLTFHISEDLKVKKIEGREDFIKNLSDINPQMKKLLESILSDKALTKMAEPAWWAYPPGGSVTKDQKWSEKATLELGPIGTYTTTFDFTYKGDDKIGIKTSLTYAAPDAGNKAGLPFVIESATLTSKSGDGEAVYDRTAGRFKSTNLDMKIEGNLEISVGNQKTSVALIQSQKANSITHDANPWADKKGN